MSYDSKHSGAVAEQMLDDYVAGNLGGDGGNAPSIFRIEWDRSSETINIDDEAATPLLTADVVYLATQGGGYDLFCYRDGASTEPMKFEGVRLVNSGATLVRAYVKYHNEDGSPQRIEVSFEEIETEINGMPILEAGLLTLPELYVASFTIEDVQDAVAAGTNIECDIVSMVAAVRAGKNIYIKASTHEESVGGVIASTVVQDYIYITFLDNGTLWKMEADPHDGYFIPANISSVYVGDIITAADLPPSGGLPTEVIELSSEITLQEGKMLEINTSTVVEGALTINRPTTVNGSQGLLWGIRFFCGQTVPQLTIRAGLVAFWMNGELPQLEPNVLVEIIGAVTYDGYAIMSWAKYK